MAFTAMIEKEAWEGFDCFTFYSGGTSCTTCPAMKRCKAVMVSHGFDIVGNFVNHLVANLPPDAVFIDSDRIPDLVEQLLVPSKELTMDEMAILEALKGTTVGPVKDVLEDL